MLGFGLGRTRDLDDPPSAVVRFEDVDACQYAVMVECRVEERRMMTPLEQIARGGKRGRHAGFGSSPGGAVALTARQRTDREAACKPRGGVRFDGTAFGAMDHQP